jgi:hypothetical protein
MDYEPVLREASLPKSYSSLHQPVAGADGGAWNRGTLGRQLCLMCLRT